MKVIAKIEIEMNIDNSELDMSREEIENSAIDNFVDDIYGWIKYNEIHDVIHVEIKD